jgi:hypothetical protein
MHQATQTPADVIFSNADAMTTYAESLFEHIVASNRLFDYYNRVISPYVKN